MRVATCIGLVDFSVSMSAPILHGVSLGSGDVSGWTEVW